MKSKRKNILFILPTLNAGGAERVISFVAQNIDKTKFKSTLLVIGKKEDAAYPIKDIELIFLEKSRVLHAIPQIFWVLLRKRPHAALSSIGHLNTVMGLLSGLFPKMKLIIREASVISAMHNAKTETRIKPKLNIFGEMRAKMGQLSLKWTDIIICQSNDMATDFKNIFKVPNEKVVIINNPITQMPPLKPYKNTSGKVKFITVGRLSKEKGQLRLLKLLSQLKFDFEYTIIGSGPYKALIFQTIDQLNLGHKINYIEYTEHVLDHISQHDLFLQGSFVEGFPNTVLESCIVGTPVLAFNVPGGTKEIITHGENGYLVETEEEYLHFLNNRLNLAPEQIRSSVEKKFNKNTILKQFEDLFD